MGFGGIGRGSALSALGWVGGMACVPAGVLTLGAVAGVGGGAVVPTAVWSAGLAMTGRDGTCGVLAENYSVSHFIYHCLMATGFLLTWVKVVPVSCSVDNKLWTSGVKLIANRLKLYSREAPLVERDIPLLLVIGISLLKAFAMRKFAAAGFRSLIGAIALLHWPVVSAWTSSAFIRTIAVRGRVWARHRNEGGEGMVEG